MDIEPRHLTLKNLLEHRLFKIPRYQRAYSWGTKHRRALFDDILENQSRNRRHFMATIVGLRTGQTEIKPDTYENVDIVDGQQRITTLILLYKAVQKTLTSVPDQESHASKLQELLVKPDRVSLLLLQTNHDNSGFFADYLRNGDYPAAGASTAATLADRELLTAMRDCEKFVDEWMQDKEILDLLAYLNNKLTFILYEISDEALVYNVFEVLNSRGLEVSWFDRLKSMLMALVFDSGTGNRSEIIDEVHDLWANIYETIGIRLGFTTESLRFAATLKMDRCPAKPLSEEDAVELLCERSRGGPDKVIETTKWLKRVTEAVDDLVKDRRRGGVTRIAQARLLAVAVNLNTRLTGAEKHNILRRWESLTFRIYGMCRKDARTGVGNFVRLSWAMVNEEISCEEIVNRLTKIGRDYPIEAALQELKESDCYEEMDGEEVRYLLFAYEEHLARQQGQVFDNVQWNHIWTANPAQSIEHILPQSTKPEPEYLNWLGNLLLLAPGLNSKLGDLNPNEKCASYSETGLLIARDVVRRMEATKKWGKEEIQARENEIMEWARCRWGD